MTVVVKIGLILIVVYVVVFSAFFFMQRKLMYRPKGKMDVPLRDKTFVMRDVVISTPDGLKLKCGYRAPEKGKDGQLLPTILYMHGNTGRYQEAAHKLIKLAEAGYGVLMLEYRGYGENGGKPSEKGLITDAESAVHFIYTQQGKNARVVYYGMSMGTGVANGLAMKRPPAAMIQEAGFSSMARAALVAYPFLLFEGMVRDSYNTEKRIKELKSPLLVLHGALDKTVPLDQAKTVFAAAGSQNKSLKVYPQGHHVDLYDFGATDEILSFLDGLFKKA